LQRRSTTEDKISAGFAKGETTDVFENMLSGTQRAGERISETSSLGQIFGHGGRRKKGTADAKHESSQ
jgi:hypothetical protein